MEFLWALSRSHFMANLVHLGVIVCCNIEFQGMVKSFHILKATCYVVNSVFWKAFNPVFIGVSILLHLIAGIVPSQQERSGDICGALQKSWPRSHCWFSGNLWRLSSSCYCCNKIHFVDFFFFLHMLPPDVLNIVFGFFLVRKPREIIK